MKKVLFLIQNILKFSLIFLISFIWLRYILKSLWLACILSLITSIILELIFFFIHKKSKYKQNLKTSEKEEAENMFLSMVTNGKYLDFYLSLVKSRHQNAIKKKDYIIINHKDKSKVLLFPFIKLQTLSLNDVINITNINNIENADKIVILCYEFDKRTLSFVRNFDYEILILDRFDCYSHLYKEYDFFPEITIRYKKEAKFTIKELLAYSFNRSRTKGYIFASFIIFITSFFVKLNIYYCIMTTILLLFALISFVNPKYNLKNNIDII